MILSNPKIMMIFALIASLLAIYGNISLHPCMVSWLFEYCAVFWNWAQFKLDHKFFCISGARRYLLHEKDEDLPRSRRNYKRFLEFWIFVKKMSVISKTTKFYFRFFLIHYTLKTIWYLLWFYIIFIKYNVIGWIWDLTNLNNNWFACTQTQKKKNFK